MEPVAVMNLLHRFDRRETELFMAEPACTSTLHAGVAAAWRVCAQDPALPPSMVMELIKCSLYHLHDAVPVLRAHICCRPPAPSLTT